MRKFLSVVILVPLGIILVMFAVANREVIAISFDPFDMVNPAFALKVPLYALIFALAGFGVLIGGIASWLKQHKWRARARRAEAEARELRARLDALEPRRPMLVPRGGGTSLILPPAA
jgi:uncharacterized integral membrane protein